MIWPEVGGKATDLCSVGVSAPDTVPLYSMITKYFPAVDPLNSLSLKNSTLGSPVLSCCESNQQKRPKSLLMLYTQDCNRQQNELRYFALNWAFLRFIDFKRRKYSFSFPIPSMQCCADVRATYRKQQTPQLWMKGAGEGCRFFCSLKLPYLNTNVSTTLSPIVAVQSSLLNTDSKGKSQVPLFQVSSL